MKIKIPKKKSSVINEGTLNEALHAYIDRSKFPKRLILENLRQKEKLFIKKRTTINNLIIKGRTEINKIQLSSSKLEEKCFSLLEELKMKILKD
jgi:hypothetical protein